MGLNSDLVDTLIFLKNKNLLPKNRNVAEIGAQQLGTNFIESTINLENFRKSFGLDKPIPEFLNNDKKIMAHGGLEYLSQNAPSSRIFWKWAQFDYLSIDVDTQFDSIPLDLNFDQVPRRFKNRFHLVTNYGTTEHIANQCNAFKVIHDLTALNGIMIHALPSQGMINHGLINYNPKFFWMLCRSNDYEVIDFQYGYDKVGYPVPENIYDFINKFHTLPKDHFNDIKVFDAGIQIILRKKHLSSFVPPLDVPNGAVSAGPKFTKRYWSIFKEDPVFSLRTTDSKLHILKKIIRKFLK